MPGLSNNNYLHECDVRKQAALYVKNKFPHLHELSNGFSKALQRRLNKR